MGSHLSTKGDLTMADDLEELDRQIKERLAANEDFRRQQRNHLTQSMSEMDERLKRYTPVADRLMKDVILPRMAKLAASFAHVQPPEQQQSRHTCTFHFPHTSRFPATVTLEFGLTRDGEARNVAVQYDLQILPVYYPFNAQAHLVMPLDGVDERRVADWVDRQVLAFVDTYLKLETVDQYQGENNVTDPVCGMHFNKQNASAEMECRGVTYYFCSEKCRNAFAEHPERYLSAVPAAAN
jgi:YHS domain-containing protein